MGTIKLEVQSKAESPNKMTFHVVETNQPGLLGLKASQELGFIKVVMNTTSPQTPKPSQVWEEETIKRYGNVFKGLGRLKKPYHIEVDPNVTPVINAPRNIPAALRDRVKADLERWKKQTLFVKWKNRQTG